MAKCKSMQMQKPAAMPQAFPDNFYVEYRAD
jgi:hypothetical protein